MKADLPTSKTHNGIIFKLLLLLLVLLLLDVQVPRLSLVHVLHLT